MEFSQGRRVTVPPPLCLYAPRGESVEGALSVSFIAVRHGLVLLWDPLFIGPMQRVPIRHIVREFCLTVSNIVSHILPDEKGDASP